MMTTSMMLKALILTKFQSRFGFGDGSKYGEIVDVNLVRDKVTGKSKSKRVAFVAYEDKSTILAVDNLNGAQVLGRTIRVGHVTKYKKKEEEDEEAKHRAFQTGW